MKAHEALIAWSGWDDEGPMAGQIAVGRIIGDGEVDWTDGYAHAGGAALAARCRMRGARSTMGVVKDFHYLVVDERLDPEAVHKVFLAIDEYAELFG